MSKPTIWTCNACGKEGDPSREHLIHVAIGRVILGDCDLTPDQVREALRSDRFKQFGRYAEPTETARVGAAWLDQWIRGLICRTCNQGWAKDLEERAGANLYDFIHEGGAADGQLLQRWAWFFAMKVWFAHMRTEFLADAPGHAVLSKIAREDFRTAMPVYVARLPFSGETWDIAGNMGGWAGASDSPFIPVVLRATAFLIVGSAKPTVHLPIPGPTQLTDGLLRKDVVELRPEQVPLIFQAPAWEPPTARTTNSTT